MQSNAIECAGFDVAVILLMLDDWREQFMDNKILLLGSLLCIRCAIMRHSSQDQCNRKCHVECTSSVSRCCCRSRRQDQRVRCQGRRRLRGAQSLLVLE